MAECFVDPASGVDSTGRGSEASPYASIQYANDDAANWADGAASTTEANTIWLANTSADVLTSPISPTINTIEANLIIDAYDAGGSLTCTVSRGRSIMCGEIDGNDAVTTCLGGNEVYVDFRNLYIHSTTSYCIYLARTTITDCRIVNGGSRTVYTSIFGKLHGCYVSHDLYTANQYAAYIAGTVEVAWDNEIVGGYYGLAVVGQGTRARENVVYGFSYSGIVMPLDRIVVYKNTVDGSDVTVSNGKGIWVSSLTTSEANSAYDNLITNMDHTGGIGVASTIGGPPVEVGNNAFYNCLTDESFGATPVYQPANVTESSDPFVDRANRDYTLKSSANSVGAAWRTNPQGSDDDIGGVQLATDAGGTVPPTIEGGIS